MEGCTVSQSARIRPSTVNYKETCGVLSTLQGLSPRDLQGRAVDPAKVNQQHKWLWRHSASLAELSSAELNTSELRCRALPLTTRRKSYDGKIQVRLIGVYLRRQPQQQGCFLLCKERVYGGLITALLPNCRSIEYFCKRQSLIVRLRMLRYSG